MKIKVLSDSTVIHIASGEVIQRPISIVKELVENSIDAGASIIDINIINGGCTLIKITDNGCGIAKDDMPFAVMRYATSKLENEDIYDVRFLGFRGEALASIVAVANVRFISRVQDGDAWEMRIKDDFIGQVGSISDRFRHYFSNRGNLVDDISSDGNYLAIVKDYENQFDIIPSQHPIGTTIEVRDLFSLTQNRLRFLKSAKYENSLCTDYIQNMALAYPEVELTLSYDNKVNARYHVYRKASNGVVVDKDAEEINRLKDRIKDVLGQDAIQNMVYVNGKDGEVELYGYVTIPTHNYTRSNKIFCFVNKRMVKDAFLNNVIKSAYNNLIPSGQYPAVVLFITLPPKLVDVNVHPSKTSIRFVNEEAIRSDIVNSIRRALSKAGVSTRFSTEFFDRVSKDIGGSDLGVYQLSDKLKGLNNEDADKDGYFINASNDVRVDNFAEKKEEYDDFISYKLGSNRKVVEKKFDRQNPIEPNENMGQAFEIGDYPALLQTAATKRLGEAICQVGFSYIIARTEDAIVIVDQHAAHERITLEELKKQFIYSSVVVQKLLIPHVIALSFQEVDLLIDIVPELGKLGFVIERNNHKSIKLVSAPSLLLDIDFQSLFERILENIELFKNITVSVIDRVFSDIACRASIRGRRKMSIEEMNHLLREIESKDYASQCNHGRPTYITLPVGTINKLFERT